VTAVAAGIRKLWSARGDLLSGIQFGAEFGQFRTAFGAGFGQFGAEFGGNLDHSVISKFGSKFDRTRLSKCDGRFGSKFDKQFGALFVEA
jgi:hypothetical protein